jgi:hypothetical protein
MDKLASETNLEKAHTKYDKYQKVNFTGSVEDQDMTASII